MIQVLTAGARCTRPQVAAVITPIVVDFDGGPSSERALRRSAAEVAVSRADADPPPTLELLASARMFMRRHDRRRALIDAGGAAESALVTLLGPQYAGQTLGSLVNSCRTVEIDATVNLVSPRNDAVHRGMAPPWPVTERAVEIVEDLVLQVEGSVTPSADLRHINRPQRTDLMFIRPSDKMVQLSEERAGSQAEGS